MAVQQYTSHMSGIVSHMSDMVALGDVSTLLWGLGALLAFIAGSASTAVIINFARHRYLQSEYALPILIEAGALMFFGLLDGIKWDFDWLWTSLTVATLCYIMGLQNAIITDISQYALRSTHITGTVTDIGIELGKAFYWNRASRQNPSIQPVQSNKKKFKLLLEVLILFFIGGVIGAYGFKTFGFVFTCVMASILVYLAAAPIIDDIKTLWAMFNEPPVILKQSEDGNQVTTTAEMAEAEELAEVQEQENQEENEREDSDDEVSRAGI